MGHSYQSVGYTCRVEKFNQTPKRPICWSRLMLYLTPKGDHTLINTVRRNLLLLCRHFFGYNPTWCFHGGKYRYPFQMDRPHIIRSYYREYLRGPTPRAKQLPEFRSEHKVWNIISSAEKTAVWQASYLLADNWLLICWLRAQCFISKNNVNSVPCDSVFVVIFFKIMYNNKTIIRFGLQCNILNTSTLALWTPRYSGHFVLRQKSWHT